MEDSCISGRKLRILNVVDEFTREPLETYVDYSIRAARVVEILELLFILHGRPFYLRSDNGPEFIATAVQQWLAAHPDFCMGAGAPRPPGFTAWGIKTERK